MAGTHRAEAIRATQVTVAMADKVDIRVSDRSNTTGDGATPTIAFVAANRQPAAK